MMRIITGKARGTHLSTLEGENTRPTAERTKEAVFSMIQNEIRDRRVLDLFSGSGQMALEALSRGAAFADMVDASPAAIKVMDANCRKTHMENQSALRNTDALTFLRGAVGQYGLVFLDPPYAAGLLPSVLRLLAARQLLTSDALLICESERPEDVFGTDTALEQEYVVRKTARYGRAAVTVLQPVKKEDR